MPSLFSHHTSCLKPTSRWRIITIIKADSWKWMVISPLGSSSSLHFPFSLFLACHCPCYKQCQVLIFCLSRSTSAQYALTDTDRHPPPLSVRQMLQEMATDWHHLPTLGLSLSSIHTWNISALKYGSHVTLWQRACLMSETAIHDLFTLPKVFVYVFSNLTASDRIIQQGAWYIWVEAEAAWILIPWVGNYPVPSVACVRLEPEYRTTASFWMKNNTSFDSEWPAVARSRCVKVFDVSHSCADTFWNGLLTVLIWKTDRCYSCTVSSVHPVCSCVFEGSLLISWEATVIQTRITTSCNHERKSN